VTGTGTARYEALVLAVVLALLLAQAVLDTVHGWR
jgi:hypothetical protein